MGIFGIAEDLKEYVEKQNAKGYFSPIPLNALFVLVRELQNIKQGKIAKYAHITSASVSAFCCGRANLKEETIENIAHCLNISSDYVRTMTGNPFKSKKLIKMFALELYLGRVDYSIFELFLDFNDRLQFLLLIPESSITISKILGTKTTELPVYAIAMKDSDNNIFIFRRKQKFSFFADEKGFQTTMNKKAKKENRHIDFKTIDIEKPIFYKILSWSIEREDVENLFGNKSEPIDLEMVIHDKGKIRLLNTIEKMGISPDKVIELLLKGGEINGKRQGRKER
jgi:transcriptional regulator with XRE-family HTH domain